jgi:hypothetical protein
MWGGGEKAQIKFIQGSGVSHILCDGSQLSPIVVSGHGPRGVMPAGQTPLLSRPFLRDARSRQALSSLRTTKFEYKCLFTTNHLPQPLPHPRGEE